MVFYMWLSYLTGVLWPDFFFADVHEPDRGQSRHKAFWSGIRLYKVSSKIIGTLLRKVHSLNKTQCLIRLTPYRFLWTLCKTRK